MNDSLRVAVILSRIPVKIEISKFFIISKNKPFGETFWKITIKVFKELSKPMGKKAVQRKKFIFGR